jgi:hypothetical protein
MHIWTWPDTRTDATRTVAAAAMPIDRYGWFVMRDIFSRVDASN